MFNTIATGGYERWKSDIEVSTKHGVLQSVGDTIGPGGIIRALRTIPVILDVAKTMEEICPDAWIINYDQSPVRGRNLPLRFQKIYKKLRISVYVWNAGYGKTTCRRSF